MSKPIIAVDVDEVLVPHFEDLITWYNKTYGTTLTLNDNYNPDVRVWGAKSDEEAIRNVQRFFESPEFTDAQPFTEAKAVLARLSQRFRLIVVTARDTMIEEMTREWLNHHFADLIEDAHFTAKYTLEGTRKSKADVCRKIGAEYLIDDSADNVVAVAKIGIQGLLFGVYPWGEVAELPAGVTRCKDWAAVEAYFDGRG